MIATQRGRQLSVEERLHPQHTALLVVDVQNDFASPAGTAARIGKPARGPAETIARLKTLIADANRHGVLVVYVRTIYDAPFLSEALAEQFCRRGFTNSICIEGTAGAAFADGIGPQDRPNEIVVTKHRFSPFGTSDIDLVLRANGIRTVVVTGIVTEICVESTARDAFFRDYRVVLATDCASPFSDEAGLASQRVVGEVFGRAMESAAVQSAWRAAGDAGPRNWHSESKASRRLVTLAEKLRPGHAALVLVDLQAGLADAARPHDATRRVQQLLEGARRHGLLVIHVVTVHAPLYSGNPVSADHPRRVEVLAGFEPKAGEPRVVKHRPSGFMATELDLLLRANGIRSAVIAGSDATGSLDATARDAAMHDYELIVPRDCVISTEEERPSVEQSLAALARRFGVVCSLDDIEQAWEARADDPGK